MCSEQEDYILVIFRGLLDLLDRLQKLQNRQRVDSFPGTHDGIQLWLIRVEPVTKELVFLGNIVSDLLELGIVWLELPN